jgi:tetratricopeptide (TPR) repeat protein
MFKEAKIELERAKELIGDDPIVYDHLGDAYFKLEILDKAKEAWKRSLELKDDGDVKKKLEDLEAQATVNK